MLAFTVIAASIAYSAACLGMGAMVLRVFIRGQNRINRISAGTQLAVTFILGQGFIANLWLLLALAGWLSPLVVIGIVSAFALCGVILIHHLILDFSSQIRSIGRELWADSWGWKITAILTLVLCLAWVTSLGRPMSYDGAAFYMVLPKMVAHTHQLYPLPGFYENFTIIGLQGEMHYAALMALGSPDAARLLDWPTVLAGAVMLLALSRQVGLKRRGQWIVFAMLFSSSSFIWLSSFGKTDLFATSFGLAAYYWIVQFKKDQQQLALLLVGLFSGFAIVAKMPYIVTLLPCITLLFGWSFLNKFLSSKNQSNAAEIIHGVLQLLMGFLLAVAPHLIKNSILFHNPIAPFGADTPSWLNQVWHGQIATRHIILTYPLALTFGSYWAQLGGLSPMVLAFLPLTLLLPRPQSLKSSLLIAISLAALVGVITWIILRPAVFAPRFMLPSLSVFFLPAARAVEYVCQNERKPRWLSTGVMVCIGITIITVALAYHNFAFFPLKTYQYLGGKLPKCARDAQMCEPMVILNKRAPLGTRLFLNFNQRYWLRPDLIQCLITYDEIESYFNIKTDAARWEFLYERGFRYLIKFNFVRFVLPDIPAPSMEQIPPWLSVTREQIGNNVILRLQAQDFSHETGFDCYQQDARIWTAISPNSDHP